MHRLSLLAVLAALYALNAAAAADDPLVAPAHFLQPDDPAWSDLLHHADRPSAITADFQENRWFPFKKIPVVLKGEVRVSAEHGLSLHYLAPDEHIIILDRQGLLVRQTSGDRSPPADPRTAAANSALLHVLSFDLRPLADRFELYGRREGDAWNIALVPRDPDLRSTLGQISVAGEGPAVRRIELRRSALQRVEILVDPPRRTGLAFTPDELHRFFR